MPNRADIHFDFERELEKTRLSGTQGQMARATLKAEWAKLQQRLDELQRERNDFALTITRLQEELEKARQSGPYPGEADSAEQQALTDQRAELERWAQELQNRADELARREADLTAREAELLRRESAVRLQTTDLDRQAESLRTEKSALAAQTAALREREAALQQREAELERRAQELADREAALRDPVPSLSAAALRYRPIVPEPEILSKASKFGPPGLASKFLSLPKWLLSQVERYVEPFGQGANEGDHDTYRRPKQWIFWSLVVRAGLVVVCACPDLWHLGRRLERGWDDSTLEAEARRVLFDFLRRVFGWGQPATEDTAHSETRPGEEEEAGTEEFSLTFQQT